MRPMGRPGFRGVLHPFCESVPRSPFLVLGWGNLLKTLDKIAASSPKVSTSPSTTVRELVADSLNDGSTRVIGATETRPEPTHFCDIAETAQLETNFRHPLLAKRYTEGLIGFLGESCT